MNAADGLAGLKEACNQTLTESQREAKEREWKRLDDMQWARDAHKEALAKLPKPQFDFDIQGNTK